MATDEPALESRLKGYIESIKDNAIPHEDSEMGDKHLVKDLAMDSLDIMNLLFKIEEQEKVEITEADLEAHALYRFGSLADYIKQKAAGS